MDNIPKKLYYGIEEIRNISSIVNNIYDDEINFSKSFYIYIFFTLLKNG